MIGGILANNSSGMCCGVAQNAYHTLDSLVFVLPSGTVIDTAQPDADEEFRRAEPALAAGLLAAPERDRRAAGASRPHPAQVPDQEHDRLLAQRLRRLRSAGRHLLAPARRLGGHAGVHRQRGAAERCRSCRSSTPGCCSSRPSATRARRIVPLRDARRRRPRSHGPRRAPVGRGPAGHSAVDCRVCPTMPPACSSSSRPPTRRLRPGARRRRPGLRSAASPARTGAASRTRRGEQAALWKVRQGMFPSVGAARRRGTTVLIEDVAFPVDRLADAVVDLRALFARHRYDEAIVFGHAKDGNLHFVITPVVQRRGGGGPLRPPDGRRRRARRRDATTAH